VKERRDVLVLRDACLEDVPDESRSEIAEALSAGAPLYVSSVKLRRLVRRGQVAEAVVQDGVMSVSLKVEVLEDGVLGQFIRVRNPQSKREFRGKVENEQTVLVGL
jgi:flagella basal body P-ring formation protein FlgA